MFEPITRKIGDLFTFIKKVIDEIAKPAKIAPIVISILVILALVIILSTQEPGITIKPFDISGFESNLSGNNIADLLCYNLEYIREVNKPINRAKDTLSLEDNNIGGPVYLVPGIAPERKSLESAISGIGTFEVAGASFKPAQFLPYLKEMFNKNRIVISGSFQKHGSNIIVLTSIEDPLTQSRRMALTEMSRTLAKNESFEDIIPEIVSNLSYMIAHEINIQRSESDKDYTSSWQAFMQLSLGRQAYLSYLDSGNVTDLDRARDFANSCRKLEPNHIGSLEIKLVSDIGKCYMHEGKFDSAKSIYNVIFKFHPFDCSLALGEVYGRNNSNLDALIAFNRAILFNNNSSVAWRNRGTALSELKRYDLALESYNKSIELNHSDAQTWINKGNTFGTMGNHNSALEMFNRALEMDLNNSRAWGNKGLALNNLHRYDEAAISLKQAVKLDPKSIGAWSNLGTASIRLHRWDEALAAFDIVTKYDGNNSFAWYNKGLCLDEMNFHEQAYFAFNKSTKFAPTYTNAWVNKSLVLLELGNLEDAHQSIEKAISLNKKSPLAWRINSEILNKLGRLKEAEESSRRAKDIEKKSPSKMS